MSDKISYFFGFIALLIILGIVTFGYISTIQDIEQQHEFNHVDVTGGFFNAQLSNLYDISGERSINSFSGRVLAVFFGFSKCPSICPQSLYEWKEVMDYLTPEEAENFQFIFVTLDPENDSLIQVTEYAQKFHSAFIGLRGNEKDTDKVLEEFHIFKTKLDNADIYEHTNVSFVYNQTGEIRLLIHHGDGAAAIAEDIQYLIHHPPIVSST